MKVALLISSPNFRRQDSLPLTIGQDQQDELLGDEKSPEPEAVGAI